MPSALCPLPYTQSFSYLKPVNADEKNHGTRFNPLPPVILQITHIINILSCYTAAIPTHSIPPKTILDINSLLNYKQTHIIGKIQDLK